MFFDSQKYVCFQKQKQNQIYIDWMRNRLSSLQQKVIKGIYLTQLHLQQFRQIPKMPLTVQVNNKRLKLRVKFIKKIKYSWINKMHKESQSRQDRTHKEGTNIPQYSEERRNINFKQILMHSQKNFQAIEKHSIKSSELFSNICHQYSNTVKAQSERFSNLCNHFSNILNQQSQMIMNNMAFTFQKLNQQKGSAKQKQGSIQGLGQKQKRKYQKCSKQQKNKVIQMKRAGCKIAEISNETMISERHIRNILYREKSLQEQESEESTISKAMAKKKHKRRNFVQKEENELQIYYESNHTNINLSPDAYLDGNQDLRKQ